MSDPAPVLPVLDTADEVCPGRLQARNASGLHPYSVNDAEFEELSRNCEPQTSAEDGPGTPS
jgi:hypothetical protein